MNSQKAIVCQMGAGVEVFTIAPEYLIDHTIEDVISKDVPPNVEYLVVDIEQIPEDRTFREAWVWDVDATNRINIDLDVAREITKTRLRKQRQPLLDALDVQFQRALETGADTSTIVAEKQRLRDITQLVDQATTPEELKSIQVQ